MGTRNQKTKPLQPILQTSKADPDTTFVRQFDTIGLIKKTKHGMHEAWRLRQYLGSFNTRQQAVDQILKAENVAGIDQPLSETQLQRLMRTTARRAAA